MAEGNVGSSHLHGYSDLKDPKNHNMAMREKAGRKFTSLAMAIKKGREGGGEDNTTQWTWNILLSKVCTQQSLVDYGCG